MQMDLNDKARGALIGMAVGEALGAPLEGLTRKEIEERVGRITGFLNPARVQPEHRVRHFQPAVYEDETQIALAVAELLSRRGRFDPELFQEKLAELGQPIDGYRFGCFRRAPRNLRIAVRRILSGAGWKESGLHTAGSTAASRGIPLGVYFRERPEERLRAAVESALVTHRDPRAVAATAVLADAVAEALQAEAGGIDGGALAGKLVESARRAEDLLGEESFQGVDLPDLEATRHQFSEALASLPELLDLDVDEALERIMGQAREKASRPITSATRGFSLTGVVSALYFFLSGLDDYVETVLDTVSEGGSTDSLGCLVGGLAGAYHGVAAVPGDWVGALKNADQLAARAEALVAADGRHLAPLVLSEAQLTRPVSRPPRRGAPPRRSRPGRPPRRGPPRGRGRPGGRYRPGARSSRSRGGRPGSRPRTGGSRPPGGGRSGGGFRRPSAGPGRGGRRSGPPRYGRSPRGGGRTGYEPRSREDGPDGRGGFRSGGARRRPPSERGPEGPGGPS